MKILILSTLDYAGAGIGAALVLDDLKSQGYDATLLVQASKQKRSDILSFFDVSKSLNNFIYRSCNYLKNRLFNSSTCKGVNPGFYFSVNNASVSARKILNKYGRHPDVIMIGWTRGFVNTSVVHDLYDLTKAKIVYMMVDNSPITGGCHYPFSCLQYQSDCSNCPAVENQQIPIRILQQKILDFKNVELSLLGTTNDCNRAIRSTLFKNANVYPCIQTNEFQVSLTKAEARNRWDIDQDEFVIMFGAQNVMNKRKGFSYLLDALNLVSERVNSRNITLLVAGSIKEENIFSFSNLSIKYLGSLTLDDLFVAYRASDVFVCSSIEDSGPMMINYSVALKVPVVSFKMGVAIDLVIQGKTGYISDLYSAQGLADGILNVYNLSNDEYEKMCQNCQLVYDEVKTQKTLSNAINRIVSSK